MEPATVRAAEAREFDAIRDLTLEVYVGGGLAGPDYQSALADVEDRARHTELIVAIVDEKVVGSVAFARHASPYAEVTAGPDEAAFRMLAVSPATRGRGIGRALVEACVDRARAGGARRVVISTETGMLAAHRLYAAIGFRPDPARDWSPMPGVSLLCYVLELD
ncbi:MAG: GNAT family N-acetyltransferase [Geodermatophilaceae bacterium]